MPYPRLPFYDNYKLATPYDDQPSIDEIAEWYGVEPDDVTDRMQMNYIEDRKEFEQTRGL